MDFNMRMFKRQQGASALGILFTITMVLFAASTAIKVTPLYTDNYTIKGALDALDEQPGITKMSSRKVSSLLMNSLRVNNVHNIKSEDIVIKKEKGRLTVNIDYEVRLDLVQNIDLLFSFENQFEAVSH